MDFGLTGKLNEYYLGNLYQQSKATGKSSGASFQNVISAKEMENTTGTSFKEMWQTRFPGAYYHVMDASQISQGIWERNDFPFEKFFQDEVDESILNWQPSGKEPAMAEPQVQARLDSTLGQKSIIVPPELEEKMKNDPELAKRVMNNVENFIATYPTRPGRICSYLISLDENGEIAHFHVVGGGGNISGPTEEEQRQFEAEQKAKRERREEYARLNEESAIKRKLQEQETDKRYYQEKVEKEAVFSAYQASFFTSDDFGGI